MGFSSRNKVKFALTYLWRNLLGGAIEDVDPL